MYRRLMIFALSLIILATAGCGETATGRNQNATGNPAPAKTKIKLLLGGSGSNLALMGKLAEKYMSGNPGVEVAIPSSIGSSGGIIKTAEGVLDIGLVSRPFKPEEEKLGLTRAPYARVAVVMAVHPEVKITGLTSEQILAIYSGKIRNWRELGGDNRGISVLSREASDSTRLILNKYINGFDAMKEVPGTVFLRTDQAMNEAIQSVPNAIGWTDLGAIRIGRLNVRPIAVDGLLPTEDMILSGKYPFIKELAFVVKGEPVGEVKKFIDFVMSWEGKKVIIENGYLPVD